MCVRVTVVFAGEQRILLQAINMAMRILVALHFIHILNFSQGLQLQLYQPHLNPLQRRGLLKTPLPFGKGLGIGYSYLKLFTGFAIAAFIA